MKRILSVGISVSTILLCLFISPGVLFAADVEVDWSVFVQNDMRVTTGAGGEAPSIYRNESSTGLSMKAALVPYKLRFVGDVAFVWKGISEDVEFTGLTTRQGVAPYYLESDAAYVEVFEILPWLDLRIGRQIVQWGAADQFNPTNNLNPLDLEDPLMFGKTIANQMIRMDFNPGGSDFILTGIWVPVFQPSQLPASALLQVGDESAELPFVSPQSRLSAERLRNIYLTNPDSYDVQSPNVRARMPKTSLQNSQVGFRAQWLIGKVDTSLSWYWGRHTVPVSKNSVSSLAPSGMAATAGAPVLRVETDVVLYYPKKQVLGFDFAGELPFLDNASNPQPRLDYDDCSMPRFLELNIAQIGWSASGVRRWFAGATMKNMSPIGKI